MIGGSFFAKKRQPRLNLPLLNFVCAEAELVLQSDVDKKEHWSEKLDCSNPLYAKFSLEHAAG
jgi:hypothetical protein